MTTLLFHFISFLFFFLFFSFLFFTFFSFLSLFHSFLRASTLSFHGKTLHLNNSLLLSIYSVICVFVPSSLEAKPKCTSSRAAPCASACSPRPPQHANSAECARHHLQPFGGQRRRLACWAHRQQNRRESARRIRHHLYRGCCE